MSRPRRKEYSKPAALALGILLLLAIQLVSALFMEEGVFSAVYHRVAGRKPTESATGTQEIAPAPDRTRLVAAMIDNHPNALPQSGVSKAAYVWEVLVEGGLTRYMAVFTSATDVPEIGPIRSARPYFLEWASGYRAIYAHVGGSDEALSALDAKKLPVDDANEFANGSSFRRDSARTAPHNAYTSIASLKALATRKGWKLESEAEDASVRAERFVESASSARNVLVTFAQGGQAAEFRYDAATRGYARTVNGRAARDRDNAPISPETLVVLEIDAVPGDDPHGKGLIAMKTTGTGKAHVYRSGRGVDAVWRRESRTSTVEILDAEGRPIPFGFGQVWYAVIAPNKGGSIAVK